MHHTMTLAAPARTVTSRLPAVAVRSDVKTSHDIAYVTRGHASGCAGPMAYYTRTGSGVRHALPWRPARRTPGQTPGGGGRSKRLMTDMQPVTMMSRSLARVPGR
jgi:hypothetical protein